MRSTLIRGGLLIDGTGGAPLPESAVLIHAGRIVAIGATDALGQPDDADVIDARGMVMLPGLIDAHVHLMHASEHTAPM